MNPETNKRGPMRARVLVPVLLAAALAACGSKPQAHAPTAIEGLDTVVVDAGDVGGGRAWDGVVEAVRQATLSAQTSGRVREVLRDVNDTVAADEVLVRLSAVEQQAGADSARAQLRAAEAAAAEADSTYKRFQSLAGDRYVSQAQLDQVRAARDAAFAARDAARAQLANAGQQAAYTTVRAPYAGVVSAREVEPGESVGTGQLLMTVFSPEALRIEVNLPQAQAEQVRTQPQARILFADGRGVDASEVTVFPSADPATHTVKVRVQLPPLDPVPMPGTTAKVAFPAIADAARLRIPESALVSRGEVNAVYVLDDGRVSLRQLRLGERRDGSVEVIAGLEPGETIAADPVAAVQALVAARQDDK